MKNDKKILAIYARHDANLTIVNENKIEIYLEFEKLTNKRYFSFEQDESNFNSQFTDLALPYFEPNEISKVVYNWLEQEQIKTLKGILPNAKKWVNVHHHISHAWSPYMFTEPKEKDIIVSIDGGGDLEDYFKIYSYNGGKINEMLEVKVNLGKPYRVLGLLSPELYDDRDKGYRMDLPLSGKKMSLLTLGEVIEQYKEPLREFYFDFMLNYDEKNDSVEKNFRLLLDRIGFKNENFLPKEEARNVLATSQYVFEETIKKYVYPFLEEGKYNRLIMVGGCALNVTMNSKIHSDFGIDMFVPPCPNDCGISLGAAKFHNPKLEKFEAPFTDVYLNGQNSLSKFRSEAYSKKITIHEMAKLLAEGMIIGTLIGPIEIGPRALGNRSYLANPLIKGMKDKLNSKQIKNREFWRPVAPIVTMEKLSEYFDTNLPSPYMSFAPKVKSLYKKGFEEITHLDGSSRIQTITKDDGWIYNLLKSVGEYTGREILMNTSFNLRGDPLINNYEDSFKIFKNSNLDAIVISKDNPKRDSMLEIFSKKEIY